MGAKLAVLQSQDVNDPRGRRYSPAERDAVYQIWRVAAGRSLSEVERRTGIARETVASWRDQDGWVDRANQEAAEAVRALPEAVGALVVTETVRSIETVIAIRDDPNASAKDRLSAAYWLAGIGGIGPVSRIEQAVKVSDPQRDTATAELTNLSGKSAEDLAAIEARFRSTSSR